MYWQKAILSSPSKRAARQNKYAVYIRYADGTASVLPKKHSGIREARSQEVEGFDDWVSLEEFEYAQQSVQRTADPAVAMQEFSEAANKVADEIIEERRR